jgi:hypothetical protein
MSTIQDSSQEVLHAVQTAYNQSYTILDIQTYLQYELEDDDMGPTKVHIDAIVACLHSTVDTLDTNCADWLNSKWGGVNFDIEYFMDACDAVVHLINHIDDSDEEEPIIPGDTPVESAN